MGSQTQLLVPVRLDALVLDRTLAVAEARADFTRLPWYDGSRVHNPDVANLSESILARPFEDQQLFLRPGVHLHWELPAGLRRGAAGAGGTSFPPVPDRWLVIRRQGEETRRWVVESNYLHPEGEGDPQTAVSIPNPALFSQTSPYPLVDLGEAYATPQPYRLLGRTVEAADWVETEPRPESAGAVRGDEPALTAAGYLAGLTAVGYGDPTFAAFYPNCHSVFGLHDASPPSPLNETVYTVLGWYSRPVDDPLAPEGGDTDSRRALAERLGRPTTSSPGKLLCHGRLVFEADADGGCEAPPGVTGVALGNTGTEALAAWLAAALADDGELGSWREEHVPEGTSPAAAIEEQLEAAELSAQLTGRAVDLQAALADARHEQAFAAAGGGTVWSAVARLPASGNRDSSTPPAPPAEVTLPDELATRLYDLNQAQRQYDRAVAEIAARRRRLYADWCKYMLCAYPPPDDHDNYPAIDEVRHFIETRTFLENGQLEPLEDLIARAGTLEKSITRIGTLEELIRRTGTLEFSHLHARPIVTAVPASAGLEPSSGAEDGSASEEETFASRVVDRARAFERRLAELLGEPSGSKNSKLLEGLVLRPGPAARFRQPAEPVVLVVGEAAATEARTAAEPPRTVSPRPALVGDAGQLLEGAVDDLLAVLPGSPSSAGRPFNGVRTWSRQPWSPFLLQWQVELFPARDGGNLGSAYSADFVTRNYELSTGKADLSWKDETAAVEDRVARGANLYRGEALLTPYAGRRLEARLDAVLEAAGGDGVAKVAPLEAARAQLEDSGFHCLSQALSGFNAALLMQQQALQLALAEPLGFPEYRELTARVATAVATESKTSPLPLNDFNPIRTGELRLVGLRLVDRFGRVKDVIEESGAAVLVADGGKMVTAETLPVARKADDPSAVPSVYLPPRLTQPARLAFHWLGADEEGQVELDPHPAASPVCGWLLPDHLDGSLAVFDAAGTALGSIAGGGWDRGPKGLDKADEIEQEHLRKVVSWLISEKTVEPADLAGFLNWLEKAQDAIKPETAAPQRALSVLIGRPLAVVRAQIGLELQGPPAADEGWTAFRRQLQGSGPLTDRFEKVGFPVVLGADHRLHDGLVGFWRETDDGVIAGSSFRSPYLEDTDAAPALAVHAAPDATPARLTLLADPHGAIHATSGILPVGTLALPTDQTAAALRRLSVTFLTAPVLDPPPADPPEPAAPALALPTEPGYAWSWLESEGEPLTGLRKPDTQAKFPGTPILREGWLRLSPHAAAGTARQSGRKTEGDP